MHVNTIIPENPESILLHVHCGYNTTSKIENKIIRVDTLNKKVESVVLNYKLMPFFSFYGGIRTALLGYDQHDNPVLLSTVYLRYLTLGNNKKIKGSEIKTRINERWKMFNEWRRLEIIYNNFPYKCVVVASGHNALPIIYEIDIKDRKAYQRGVIYLRGKRFYGLEVIKNKNIHKKLINLYECAIKR